jgi:exodeoxyribonuclease V alpha subunit
VYDDSFKFGHTKAAETLQFAVDNGDLSTDGSYLWTQRTEDDEEVIAQFIKDAGWPIMGEIHPKEELDPDWLAGAPPHTVIPTPEQQFAVCRLANVGIGVITGSAGTGKTTTVRGLLAIKNCRLMSFTGQAAVVMQRVTGEYASTVHSFLWKYDAAVNTDMPSEWSDSKEDVAALARLDWLEEQYGQTIIVDEASMLSLDLAARLFRAARELHSQVILVGDVNQLPSIGPGQVFYDIIRSGVVPVASLSHNHRSGSVAGIVAGAADVLAGTVPVSGPGLDVCMYNSDSEVRALTKWFYQQHELNHTDWAAAPALTWMRSTKEELNFAIQDIRNPYGKEWHDRWHGGEHKGELRKRFRIGDPVVHLHNDAMRGLVNGSRGVVANIESSKITVFYKDDDVTAKYSLKNDEIDDIDLAFVMTVHKMQGGQAEYVVVCLPYANKNTELSLLYTAITRAETHALVISTLGTLRSIVRNDKRGTRRTRLVQRIHENIVELLTVVDP